MFITGALYSTCKLNYRPSTHASDLRPNTVQMDNRAPKFGSKHNPPSGDQPTGARIQHLIKTKSPATGSRRAVANVLV
ncbi:hypothetical protein QC763_0006050 [Podospora pseudopauciseta]|uniref:Uncharacterized protein n=1 Tax=Podospora pseudopauciseta TaxID=2093780 RepID=A0ABR0HX35_9PEZI|nr:hypothetical protein QC763_0006050 [Podospora pseudopauciseta]